MRQWLKAMTVTLALLVCAALPLQAHDRHGRKHKHGRRVFLTRHWNNANPTPGIPRRVRRGRNLTPGIPRGPIGHRTGIVPIIRAGRGRDHADILQTERNRDRDLAGAVGHGIGMRRGGHGHGRKP
ncbi:MAG: hypothetical protein ACJ74W_19955 [Pyrinomonadaceae bacterium]